MINLLYKKRYAINDNIYIVIPKVGDVVDNESTYYGLLAAITATPADFIFELDSIGIDFSTIDDWELFLLLFEQMKMEDTSLIFGDLDLTKFQQAINNENGQTVLLDNENNIVIDKAIHMQIATVLRKIHHLQRNNKKPANEEAKKFMIQRAREKAKRNNKRNTSSQIESLIIALCNTEQYKYDFERTRELSIYQFNESVRQVIQKTDYDNRMIGVYTGNINVKELSSKDLNWLLDE